MAHSLNVAAWPLSSALCPEVPLPPTSSGASASLFFSAATRRWDDEYLAGFGAKLFACELPADVEGLRFADAAAMLYERLTLVMVAIYRTDRETGQHETILSPGASLQVRVKDGDLACVLAQSEEHAQTAHTARYFTTDIRTRWQEARNRDALSDHSQAQARLLIDGGAEMKVVDIPPASASDQPVADSISAFIRSPAFSCGGRILKPLSAPPSTDGFSRPPAIPSTSDGDRRPASAPGPVNGDETDPLIALSKFVSDAAGHIDPVSGQPVGYSPSAYTGLDVRSTPTDQQRGSPSTSTEDRKEREDGSGDRPAPSSPSPGGDEADQSSDPYHGHVVLCGFIDSRVINFVRRFCASDDRQLVLVPASKDSLPQSVQQYLAKDFPRVHVVPAEEERPAAEQGGDDGDSDDTNADATSDTFLGYTHPCFGHRHVQSSNAPGSADGNAGADDSNRTEPPPRPALDEFAEADRTVSQQLRSTDRVKHPASMVTVAADDGAGATPLSHDDALSRGCWYRRACVHRADHVLVLANPYADANSTDDGLQDVDERAQTDRDSLVLHSGLQAHLLLCRMGRCPTATAVVDKPLVSVELLHSANARLLRQSDAATVVKFEPEQPQDVGWQWLYHQLSQCWHRKRNDPQAQRDRRRARMAHSRADEKRQRTAALKGTTRTQEEQLDRSEPLTDLAQKGRSGDDSGEAGPTDSVLDEEAQEQAQRRNFRDFAKAFRTSNGLIFSSSLLHAVVVQAFYHPLVYDTVRALAGGAHLRSPDAAASGRVRVEMALLDVPRVLVGRTFGFMQLLLMLECSWVALGVYRHKREAAEIGRRTRTVARAVAEGKSTADALLSSGPDGPMEAIADPSSFVVLTNPPPDLVLHSQDRVYVLVHRQL